jgi:catechol 2,3-dioxygenase-like lactoylglutathione lyase family enzyme
MTITQQQSSTTERRGGVPTRLHHDAYVTRDMEATRHFYEDILGIPLIATWTEIDELYGKDRAYCHCFFGLGDNGDGGSLAFFQFEPQDQDEFEPSVQTSPFIHVAFNCDAETQQGIKERLAAAGYTDPKVWTVDHGYCVSMYVTDELNRVRLEFTVDCEDAERINAHQREVAHAELARWLSGDHHSNNPYRA